MSESDDDIPCLSADTFAALQEFYAEQVSIGKKSWNEVLLLIRKFIPKRQFTMMYP